jgi:hypothetical protein
MNPRLATIATWCREMAIPASVLAGLALFGSVKIENSGATPFVNHLAPALTADAKFADKAPASKTRVDKAPADTKVADTPQPIAADDVNVAVASASVRQASADVTPALHDADTTPAQHEPEPIVTAALSDPSETLPSTEAPPEQAASVLPPANPPASAATHTADTTEVLDECFVVDACVDRYLFALYQRTPKEDSVKEQSQRQVMVKRKGKMVAVTRTSTNVVDEDFAWKDPKAADKAGMSMMDYVIGGVDRDFKLRLFHMLHAAEQAGLSPGITSAFRDDYRQSIASGLKAASDRSYHGGSFRGGYGHGLAADVVSTDGATRTQRQASTEIFWSWIDAHGKEFGIGRPYLDHDPPHIAPIDGKEYADHNPKMRARQARSASKPRNGVAVQVEHGAPKRTRTARS